MANQTINWTLSKFKTAMVVMVGLVLAGCESSPAPESTLPSSTSASMSKAVAKPRANKKLPFKETKEAEKPTVAEYSYRPLGKRDPFRSVLDDMAEKAVEAASAKIQCGPLCKWDLEQLRLVAVVSGISKPFGMVEDPNGVGYIIKRNASIGRRNGKVSQVLSGEIVITEVYKDQAEKPFVNSVVLKLPAGIKDVGQDDVNLFMPEVTE